MDSAWSGSGGLSLTDEKERMKFDNNNDGYYDYDGTLKKLSSELFKNDSFQNRDKNFFEAFLKSKYSPKPGNINQLFTRKSIGFGWLKLKTGFKHKLLEQIYQNNSKYAYVSSSIALGITPLLLCLLYKPVSFYVVAWIVLLLLYVREQENSERRLFEEYVAEYISKRGIMVLNSKLTAISGKRNNNNTNVNTDDWNELETHLRQCKRNSSLVITEVTLQFLADFVNVFLKNLNNDENKPELVELTNNYSFNNSSLCGQLDSAASMIHFERISKSMRCGKSQLSSPNSSFAYSACSPTQQVLRKQNSDLSSMSLHDSLPNQIGESGAYVDELMGGGRLRTKLALESGQWAHERRLSSLASPKRPHKTNARNANGITSRRHTQFTFRDSTFTRIEQKIESNKILEKLVFDRLFVTEDYANVLDKLMLEWNFGDGGIFERVSNTDRKLPLDFREHPLSIMGIQAVDMLGLIDNLNIPKEKLCQLMLQIESKYKSRVEVPYHNALHACDVLHACYYFVYKTYLHTLLPDVTLFALMFGASIHDVAHPGLNNSYHVNAMTDLAIRYSDRHVLEHYHLSLGFQILRREDCDVTAALSKVDRKVFRELVIEMVLATDLINHFDVNDQFKDSILHDHTPKNHPPNLNRNFDGAVEPDTNNGNTKLINNRVICSMLLHCADVSCVAKAWPIYEKWISLLFEEFHRQGDEEKRLGLEVAPFMDREKSNPADAQQVFIKFIACESLELLTTWLPELQDPLMTNLEKNFSMLQQLADEHKSSGLDNKDKIVNIGAPKHLSEDELKDGV